VSYLDPPIGLNNRLAYNLGRPVFPFADEQLHLGRLFVSHPWTTMEDCRLLSACELLTYRRKIVSHLS